MQNNQHRKTCKRHNVAGHAHALTFSCFRGQQFLNRDRTRQWLVEAIRRACDKHEFDLWAYVVMPEHVHLLVCPRPSDYSVSDYSVSDFLKSVKQSVARKAVHFVKEAAPAFLSRMRNCEANGQVAYRFWQRGGGYDRNLHEPTTVWAEVDYIHANPVRCGLCERPTDWQWSSAAEWETPGSGLLTLGRESFPKTRQG